jgi:uncharacterized protein (DUF1015 family)
MTETKPIIRPFRAIHYPFTAATQISEVMAPPFDIISEDVQAELLKRHEHNFVRVELSEGSTEESDPDSRYARAAGVLRQWLSAGVLMREGSPSLYLLEQEFSIRDETWRRRGVFGLIRLPNEGETPVLAHEGTLAAAKADRLRLMRACRAMTSPIMLMCEDETGRLAGLLHEVSRDPDAAGEDRDGIIHRVWVLTDPGVVGAICEATGPGPLFIADGHHRFETAQAHRREMRRAFPDAPPDAGFNFALGLVTSARDRNLRIFPTHRLISGLGAAGREKLRAQLGNCFDVQPRSISGDQAEDIRRWLDGAPADRHIFGAYCGDGEYSMLMARDDLLPEGASVVEGLDVSVLHRTLIDPLLTGVGAMCSEAEEITHDAHATGMAAAGARLTYTTDEREAVAAVDRGGYDCAFFLRATRVEDVIAAARAGERMPGKSTYFYPKVPAGIVLSDASEHPI